MRRVNQRQIRLRLRVARKLNGLSSGHLLRRRFIQRWMRLADKVLSGDQRKVA
jgi:hypothetical protein